MKTGIRFEARDVPVAPGQTVLEALLAAGLVIPNGCRSGACQACLLRCVDGEVPRIAQAGLRPSLRNSGHLLACQVRPTAPLVLARPDTQGLRWQSHVLGVEPLCDSVFRLRLERPAGFEYLAGQYVTLWRDAETCRAYSLAGMPDEPFLEFHVRKVPSGIVSAWLAALQPGTGVELQGPAGDCVYDGTAPEAPLLLAGTGTGIAPLHGILQNALRAEHRGAIHVIHAVSRIERAYLDTDLRQLGERYENLEYRALAGNPEKLLVDLREIAASFAGWRIFLCGVPDIVFRLRRQLFLAGASAADIRADAFLDQTRR